MLKNEQPILKPIKKFEGTYLLHSIFYTLQGEGPFAGTPAVFVRLGGCNLRCPFCDTEYTEGARELTTDQILHLVKNRMKSGLVVITGGEPFRQQLQDLFAALVIAGYYVQVETNGTLPAPKLNSFYSKDISNRTGVFVVVSPKTGKVNPYTEEIACCFKYVMHHHDVMEDGLPSHALGHTANPMLARPSKPIPIYLQPADHKDEFINNQNTEACLQSCLANGYILQLQLHKLLELE